MDNLAKQLELINRSCGDILSDPSIQKKFDEAIALIESSNLPAIATAAQKTISSSSKLDPSVYTLIKKAEDILNNFDQDSLDSAITTSIQIQDFVQSMENDPAVESPLTEEASKLFSDTIKMFSDAVSKTEKPSPVKSAMLKMLKMIFMKLITHIVYSVILNVAGPQISEFVKVISQGIQPFIALFMQKDESSITAEDLQSLEELESAYQLDPLFSNKLQQSEPAAHETPLSRSDSCMNDKDK